MDLIVHAILKNVRSNHTAKNVYGNVNYAKTFIQGTVVNVFDRRVLGGKNEQHDNQYDNQHGTWAETTKSPACKVVVGEVCGIHR